MKFKVLVNFRRGYVEFEAGNSHDQDTVGFSAEEMGAYYNAGFILPEDKDDAKEVNPLVSQTLSVDSVQIQPQNSVL